MQTRDNSHQKTIVDHLEKEPKDTLKHIISFLADKDALALRTTCKQAHGDVHIPPYRVIYPKHYLKKAALLATRWWEVEKHLLYFTCDGAFKSLSTLWTAPQGHFIGEFVDHFVVTSMIGAQTLLSTALGPPLIAVYSSVNAAGSMYGFFKGAAKDIKKQCENHKHYSGIEFPLPSEMKKTRKKCVIS